MTLKIHKELAIIEFKDEDVFQEVTNILSSKEWKWMELSNRMIVLDRDHQEEMVKMLTQMGHYPLVN